MATSLDFQSMSEEEMKLLMRDTPAPAKVADDDLTDMMGRIRIVDTEGTAAAEAAVRIASHGHTMIVPCATGPYKLSPEPVTEDGWHENLALLYGNTEVQMLMQDISFCAFMSYTNHLKKAEDAKNGNEHVAVSYSYEMLYRYLQSFGITYEHKDAVEHYVRVWPASTPADAAFPKHVRTIGISPVGIAAAMCRHSEDSPILVAALDISHNSSHGSDWRVVPGYEIPAELGLPKLANIDASTVSLWWEPANMLHVIHLKTDVVQKFQLESREQGLILDYVIANDRYAFVVGAVHPNCNVPGHMRIINLKAPAGEPFVPFMQLSFTPRLANDSSTSPGEPMSVTITVVFPNELPEDDEPISFVAGTDEGLLFTGVIPLPIEGRPDPVKSWCTSCSVTFADISKREAHNAPPAAYPVREPITFVCLRSLRCSDLTMVTSGDRTLNYFSSSADTLNAVQVRASQRCSLYHDVDRASPVVSAAVLGTTMIDHALNGSVTIHRLRQHGDDNRVVYSDKNLMPIDPKLAYRSLYVISTCVAVMQPDGSLVFLTPLMDEAPVPVPTPTPASDATEPPCAAAAAAE